MFFLKINQSDLIGKTIKSVNIRAINVAEIIFDDDSKIEIWAEDALFTEKKDSN
jgi:hypothetical protein